MLCATSISFSSGRVNIITAQNCIISNNFADIDINDVLENIKILLNYIKKEK